MDGYIIVSANPVSISLAPEPKIFVLVAENHSGDRFVLQRMLMGNGLTVEVAASCEDALLLCADRPPDLVLTGVRLPGSDGRTLVHTLRARYPNHYFPVIFVTDADHEEDLLACFAAGGNDVVVKPVNQAVLSAKLAAALRLRRLNQELSDQHEQLARYRDEIDRDMRIAKSIIDNLGAEKKLAVPNARHHLQPMDTLNGDVIISARSPAGAQCFLIGDFTGHGLPAAIGVLVVHGVFTAMVARGHPIENIAAELNRKVRALLPRDRFLSAILVEIFADTGTVSVWNGGMPEVFVFNSAGELAKGFRSTHLPLGILTPDEFDGAPTRRMLNDGDSLFLYSDGVTEAVNGADEMFGSDRLRLCLSAAGDDAIAQVRAALCAHTGNRTQSDDISMLHVRCDWDEILGIDRTSSSAPVGKAATRWQASFGFAHDALRTADPLPLLASVMDMLQGFGPRNAEICLILTELFSNALEHGLLELDSALKADANGIAQYYDLRQQRLAALAHGEITISLAHRPQPDGGLLEIRVRDSGNGFIPTQPRSEPATNSAAHGRGTSLVRSLSESLTYADRGREAIATYRWRQS
jgi:serine phosphatase RsbU (regulator of sigma subunit)/anti-sigma regulatory factor (Ser/Thr protein kinase)